MKTDVGRDFLLGKTVCNYNLSKRRTRICSSGVSVSLNLSFLVYSRAAYKYDEMFLH